MAEETMNASGSQIETTPDNGPSVDSSFGDLFDSLGDVRPGDLEVYKGPHGRRYVTADDIGYRRVVPENGDLVVTEVAESEVPTDELTRVERTDPSTPDDIIGTAGRAGGD